MSVRKAPASSGIFDYAAVWGNKAEFMEKQQKRERIVSMRKWTTNVAQWIAGRWSGLSSLKSNSVLHKM